MVCGRLFIQDWNQCKERSGVKLESLCPSVCSIVPGPYLSYGDHWNFLLYINIACDLMVCHDFDPESFGQGQGH